MSQRRVLLADDHAILRAGVRALLESTGTIEVVGEASDGREAVRLTESLRPDVLVIDVAMPHLSGLDALRALSHLRPRPAAIVLSVHAEPEYILEALSAGALGYLLKVSAFSDLLVAIDQVMLGRRHLGHGISEAALTELLERNRDGADTPIARLSPRERQVLRLIAEGRNTDEIAQRLHISAHTVQTHRKHLLDKLGLHSAVELTRFALRHGLIAL